MTSNLSTRKRTASDEHEVPTKRRSRPHKHRKRPPRDEPAPPTSEPSEVQSTTRRQRTAQLNGLQPSHVFGYSVSASRWLKSSGDPEHRVIPTSLKLLTYNTWSSSPEHTQSQTHAILSLLSSSRADIVSLQEVSRPFETALRSQGWVQAEWNLTSLDEFWRVAGKDGQGKGKKEAQREGVVVLIRRSVWSDESEVGFVKLKRANNEQAKALLLVRIVRAGLDSLRIATSHFSSLPQNARLRQSQYATTLSLLNAHPRARHSILLGDFNASSATELDPLGSTLRDVGPAPSKAQLSSVSTPGEALDLKFRHRPTFGALYPLVTANATKPRKPRRIDRIYVSKGTKHSQYRELGGDAIEGERDELGKNGKRYPSDHLAVGVMIDLN